MVTSSPAPPAALTAKDSGPRRCLPVRILIAGAFGTGATAEEESAGYRRFIMSKREFGGLGVSSVSLCCCSVSISCRDAGSLGLMTWPNKWVAEALASRSALTSSASPKEGACEPAEEDPSEIFGVSFLEDPEDDALPDDGRPVGDLEEADEERADRTAERRAASSDRLIVVGVSSCEMMCGGGSLSSIVLWLSEMEGS